MTRRIALILALLANTAHAFTVPSRQSARTLTKTPPHQLTEEGASAFRARAGEIPVTALRLQLTPDAVATSTVGDGLTTYFMETLISNGVPALFSIIVIAFAASAFARSSRQRDAEKDILKSTNPVASLYNDLYGTQQQGPGSRGMLSGFFPKTPGTDLPKNTGVPEKQYITIKYLNEKLESYRYSLSAATQSKATAAAALRKSAFARAIGRSTADLELEPSVFQQLQQTEADFLKQGAKLQSTIQVQQTKLTQAAVDEELQEMGLESVYQLDPAKNATMEKSKQKPIPINKNECKNLLIKAQKELQDLELKFFKDVVRAVGPAAGPGIRTALLGDIAARGSGGLLSALQERPLKLLLAPEGQKPSVFVARFPGDATASQVRDLREEVTAIVQSCKPGDEAMVILQTGGGTVTGYGLAAAQLQRLKDAGLKLTIAVEQVAASGGYMMTCVADRIVASPFAVLGSIGVITDIPNVYNRLKEEGIEFQTVTAGKFKRTLTPTKKVTKEDFEKTKKDVEQIFILFRDFVAKNRPQLDIEEVATGETWFGKDALERGLCDELKTADDVLLEFVGKGYDVYEVAYTPPPEPQLGGLRLLPAGENGSVSKSIANIVRMIARSVMEEIRAESEEAMMATNRVDRRYKAIDESVDRYRIQD